MLDRHDEALDARGDAGEPGLLAALQGQTRRLELALDAARLGIFAWNAGSGQVMLENDRMHELLGVPATADRATQGIAVFASLFAPDDLARFHAFLADLIAGHADPAGFRARAAGRPGRPECWIECTGRVVDDDDGGRAVIGVVADISERLARKQALQNAVATLRESDERKSRFLFTLGHELRNFLTPLTVGMQILRTRFVTDETRNLERLMTRQLDHLARLADDIVDLRRIQAGELRLARERGSLNRIVAEAVEVCGPAIESGRHLCTVDLPARDLVVDGDRLRLTQAIVNLVTNACKFTPPGGEVVVTLRPGAGQDAVLTVRDNGIGLAEDALDAVFGLYAHVHVDGTPGSAAGIGIGLHLVRHIVERHGGTVKAHSDGPGRGAVMTVTLPLARPHRQPRG